MKYHGLKILKKNIQFCIITLTLSITTNYRSQDKVGFWNNNTVLTSWRIPMNSSNNPVEYIDLDIDINSNVLKCLF